MLDVLIALLFKTMLVLAGALACGAAVWSRHMNRKAREWPAVAGTIVACTLEPDSDEGHHTKVAYEYMVAGRTYRSSLFSYAGEWNDPRGLQGRMAAYPVGKSVPVYYDPRKPARAVLERNESYAWLLLCLIGALFVYTGLVLS